MTLASPILTLTTLWLSRRYRKIILAEIAPFFPYKSPCPYILAEREAAMSLAQNKVREALQIPFLPFKLGTSAANVIPSRPRAGMAGRAQGDGPRGTRFLNVRMASRMLRGLFSSYVPPMNGRRLPAPLPTFPVCNFAIYFARIFAFLCRD